MPKLNKSRPQSANGQETTSVEKSQNNIQVENKLPSEPSTVRFANETPDPVVEKAPQISETELPEVDRENLIREIIAQYQNLEKLQSIHQNYNHQLSDIMKKRKPEDVAQDASEKKDFEATDKMGSDIDQRYASMLTSIGECSILVKEAENERKNNVLELKTKYDLKVVEMNEKQSEFTSFRRKIAASSVNSKTGKPLPSKVYFSLF